MTCRVIKYRYWKKVERLATKLGLDMEHEPGAHPGKLWIAMHGKDGKTIGREEAGVVLWRGERYTQRWYEREKNDKKTEAQSGVRSAGQDDAVQNHGSRGKVEKMVQWSTQVAGDKMRPTQTQ